MEDLKINSLTRTLGVLQVVMGIKTIQKGSSDFKKTTVPYSKMAEAVRPFGMVPLEMDLHYAVTSWDNLQAMLDTVNGIIKWFPWVANFFDCDNRAELTSALISGIFQINSVGRVYCKVNTPTSEYTHWANIAIDDAGNAYLSDADNKFLRTKITANNLIMGVAKYNLQTLRIG